VSKKSVKVLFATLFILGGGRAAGAQELPFGEPRSVVLSAERLFGFVHSSATQTVGGLDVTSSQDAFSLLSNPIAAESSSYGWPRVSLDVFVANNVSVGGAVAYFNLSRSQSSTTGVLFAPRAGFAAHLTSRVSIWLRGGFTYESFSDRVNVVAGAATTTTTFFALTMEAPLVISILPHVGLLIGPSLDYGLSGSVSTGGSSVDQRNTDFGIHAGLLAQF